MAERSEDKNQSVGREFSRYEKARILGARALQIAMNAPLLIKMSEEDLEKVNYDALKIAEIELDSNVLPISVKQPLPEKREGKLKKEKYETSDDELREKEQEEEKEISQEGEIMQLTKNEEETEEESDKEETGAAASASE